MAQISSSAARLEEGVGPVLLEALSQENAEFEATANPDGNLVLRVRSACVSDETLNGIVRSVSNMVKRLEIGAAAESFASALLGPHPSSPSHTDSSAVLEHSLESVWSAVYHWLFDSLFHRTVVGHEIYSDVAAQLRDTTMIYLQRARSRFEMVMISNGGLRVEEEENEA